jgi:Fe-S-cluster containining protein
MIETEAELEGRRLHPGERLAFSCHAGLACFNRCCRDKRLPLLPYDVLRLRRALALASPDLLARHAELELDPASGWPALRIRLEADGRCPFVSEAGCSVYADRPTCCRIYPLSRAVRPGLAGAPPSELFHALEPAGCLGWGEPRELTLAELLEEQGLPPYHAANNRLLGLLLHPARPRPLALDERELHIVILALYNLDLWREAITAPGFAERFGLPPPRLAAARASDEALLELGQDWLEDQLFGDRS